MLEELCTGWTSAKHEKEDKKGLKPMNCLSGLVAALALWGFVSEGRMAWPCTTHSAVLWQGAEVKCFEGSS